MNTTILGVETITYAIKARKLLSGMGIPSKLIKADKIDTRNGCGYAIEIDSNDFLSAVAVLRRHNINYTLLASE